MKIIVTTTYSNIDQEFLDSYLRQMEEDSNIPGSSLIVEDLKKYSFAAFTSNDPDGPTEATTTYRIIQ